MSKQSNLTQKIEAALFVSSGPITISELAKKLQADAKEITHALEALETILRDRGLCLIKSSVGYELAVAPNMRDITAAFTEGSAPTLSQSSLEVLTIIAYEGPCVKATIDEIRGTPSDNSLRALLSRDLVTQLKTKSTDETMRYELTSFAWRSLGITGRDGLPPKPRAKKRDANATQ